MSLLAFENVSKSYGATPALENVSLDIPAGKIVGLLGPNGSGKTTLIKLINGLLQPDQGRVLINDMDPSPATKAIVAYLPDTTYLNEQMKVKEALTYFKTFYKISILNAPIIYLQTWALMKIVVSRNYQKGIRKRYN